MRRKGVLVAVCLLALSTGTAGCGSDVPRMKAQLKAGFDTFRAAATLTSDLYVAGVLKREDLPGVQTALTVAWSALGNAEGAVAMIEAAPAAYDTMAAKFKLAIRTALDTLTDLQQYLAQKKKEGSSDDGTGDDRTRGSPNPRDPGVDRRLRGHRALARGVC